MNEVHARTLAKQPTVVLRGVSTVEDLPVWLGQAYDRVGALLRASGSSPAGPPFARYRPQGDDRFAVEAGFPVEVAVPGAGEVESGSLPDGPAAVTWHVGSYETLGEAYDSLHRWISAKGGVPVGTAWEIYHDDPTEADDPQRVRTEVVMPYFEPA